MALYSAGEVGIDVKAVTDGFYEDVRRTLMRVKRMSAEVEVNFDPDTTAYDAVRSRINGDTLHAKVKVDGDVSGLKRINDELKRFREDNGKLTFAPKLNTSGFLRDMDNLARKGAEKFDNAWSNAISGFDMVDQGPLREWEKHLYDIADTMREISKLRTEHETLDDKYESAVTDNDVRNVKRYASEIVKLDQRINDLTNRYRQLHKLGEDKDWADSKTINQVKQDYANATPFVKKFTDEIKASRMQMGRFNDENSDANKYLKAFNEAIRDIGGNTGRASKALSEYRREADDLTGILNDADDELARFQKSISSFKPWGANTDLNRELNRFRENIRKTRDELRRNPISARASFDTDEFDRKYADLLHKATELSEKLNHDYEIDVRIKHWEGEADRLERRLYELEHTRIDIPVDWKIDQESIIRRMRDVAARIRIDPDRAWELEADLDLNMRRAEQRLEEFEEDHDKLDMDLDLKTALASAHLKYFTRPRTVDIYANFKSTDLGKIINGITYGATGLEGVNNQFQKLVKLFDQLDDVVPKFSLIGAAAISLGAGLLNVGRSIGGVGASLVSMSKAALAAPAALVGLGSAAYGVYAAYKVFDEQFDVTQTKLNGLTTTVGTAAWNEYGDELYRIANDIAPTLISGLSGIATEEGKVAAGLLQVVERSDEAGELPRIFERTSRMVQQLNPGLQDLLTAFLDLGDETSVYLPRMGGYISDVAASMAEWVEQARQSGAITDAMEAAIEQGGYLKDSFKSLTGILSGTFGTLAQTENGIQGISEALAKADDAVNSVKFQETLEAWSSGAQTAQDNMRDSLDDIGDALYSLRDETEQVFGDAGAIIGSGIEGISRVLEQSGDGIGDFSKGVRAGFEDVFDAIGDAAPMFDDLLSMVGQLSKTFGGTLASGLKTAAPLISAIATAAETTAKAFDALPDSVKGAITLYMTFGRAGQQALDSIKTGMLTNIMQTAQYQKALAGLGLSATSLDTSFKGVLKSWLQMRGVDVSAFTALGESAKGASGKVSGLSTVLGGLGGVLKSAAIGGAIGLVTVAVSDFIQKGQATEQVANDIGTSLADMSGMAESAAQGVDLVAQKMQDAFSDGEYAEGGWNWLSDLRNGFDSAAEAAEKTKISIADMSDAIIGGSDSYSELRAKLVDVQDAHTTWVQGMSGGVRVQDATAKAAQKQIEALDQMNKDYRENARQLALANGYAEDYADSLIDAGEDATALSIILGDAETRTKMLAEAQRIAADAADDQRLAQRDLISAQTDYGESLESAKSQIEDIKALAETTGAVWDENAKSLEGMSGSFNTASEAGRQAQQVLQDLGDSGHDLLESMVDAGATSDEVKAKQAELAQSFYDTATAMGVPEDAAKRLQEVYGLTPTEVETLFKAKVEESKATLTQYLANLRALFPDEGNTAVFTAVLNAIDSGAVQGITEVYDLFTKLMNGNVSSRAVQLLLNADGDALWKTQNVQKNLEALGMTKDTYTWLLNGEGTAEERMAKVREELEWLNLSDDQINWILDCIDKASEKLDKTNEKKSETEKPISFTIDADDTSAQTKISNVRQYEGQVIANPWAIVHGDNMDAMNKFMIVMGYNGLTISQPWGRVLGDNLDAMNKFGEIMGYDGATIARPWGRVRGENNEARNAFNEVRAYDGRTISEPWGRVMGNADNAWSVFRSIQNMNGTVLATRYVDIITRSGGDVRAATGGRVSGPGTGTSDSIPAMLSNGEMVIRAASVRKLDAKYGAGWLEYLNRMGDVPNRRVSSTVERYRRDSYAYASGGRVRVSDVASRVDNSRVLNISIDARRVRNDPRLASMLTGLADYVERYSNM